MAHERLLDDQDEIKAPSNRSFGTTVVVVLVIIGTLPLFGGGNVRWWPWIAAFIFSSLTWLRAQWLTPLNRWWLKLGLALGHVVSPIAMAIVFYLVITPIGFLMRRLGKATMRMPFDERLPSYWLPRDPPGPAPDSLNNQF